MTALGMNEVQMFFWERMLASGAPLAASVKVSMGFGPQFADTVRRRRLYLPKRGILSTTAFLPDVPRVAALAMVDGQAVAFALLIPTTCHRYCRSAPVAGFHKIGQLGVYVQAKHRGHGYARRCVEAIAVAVNWASIRDGAPFLERNWRLCVMADGRRVVPWAHRLFHVPMIAERFQERTTT